jgi:hypothetical protein
MGILMAERVRIADDPEAVMDWLAERRLGDGLPVIVPTPDRVERMLSEWTGDSQQVISEIPPHWAEATAEKLAINAVMAGCRPEYFPVIVAAVRALSGKDFDLYGVQATTNPVTPLVVVNGPIRHRITLNCGAGVLGPGWRANATIGRAIRLILINLGGAVPGPIDKSTLGQPAKYTSCIGENEEENPWTPLHVERGFSPDDSVVTVLGIAGTVNVVDTESKSAAEYIKCLAGSLMIQGSNNMQYGGTGIITVVLCPEYAKVLAEGGFSKDDVKRYMWENGTIPLERFSVDVVSAIKAKYAKPWLSDGLVRATASWQDIHIIVAGGAGPHSNVMPSSAALGRVVSARIELPDGRA